MTMTRIRATEATARRLLNDDAAFDTWVQALDDDARPCTLQALCHCPLRQYIDDCGYEGISIGYRGGVVLADWQYTRESEATFMSPRLRQFVTRIDDEPTAWRAMTGALIKRVWQESAGVELTVEAFRAWLVGLPSDTDLGPPGNPLGCPLHRYLTAHYPDRANGLTVYYDGVYENGVCVLPWPEGHPLNQVQRDLCWNVNPGQRVSPGMVRAALDQVLAR